MFWELELEEDMAGRTEGSPVMLVDWLAIALPHTLLLVVYCWRLVADSEFARKVSDFDDQIFTGFRTCHISSLFLNECYHIHNYNNCQDHI